ncbi:CoA-transferase subunit beta [Vogesella oryzae]|uniref:CoA-transferase subunit beta n=1 Tax=Vogesella oryzae TaxID=1735285 RepID=UPI00158162E1|nr:CoA-transferase subunit beta [Vogesella oryzae]
MNITWTADEMMTVAAARRLGNGIACFVGIGLPSAAANLARLTHAPEVVLIYESGTLGTRPDVLPLSIGDDELAEKADSIVSMPEIFRYYLQAGRIDVGFLGAAQVDRYGNLNSTFIGGDYEHPATRLPGAGGAPEIAASAGEVLIVLKQGKRSFVEQLDFMSSAGYFSGGDSREKSGATGRGPSAVITDLGILTPDPVSRELTLTSLHPGISVEQVIAATGWPLQVAAQLDTTPPPTAHELSVLRDLHARTRAAHSQSKLA